jgi:hypothetical protein
VLYLEWLCIQEAKKAKRYLTKNGTNGSKPHTPAPLEADCREIFDTARILATTLGYPVFDPVLSKDTVIGETKLYYCTRGGVNAFGEYTAEGFVVHKGSKGRGALPAAFADLTFGRRRSELLKQGKVVVDGDVLLFTENVLFATPSGASSTVVGNTSSGWKDWKDADGNMLEENEKPQPEAKTP